jgi:hypothetical protein
MFFFVFAFFFYIFYCVFFMLNVNNDVTVEDVNKHIILPPLPPPLAPPLSPHMKMNGLTALPVLVLECILGYVDDGGTILRWSYTNRHFLPPSFAGTASSLLSSLHTVLPSTTIQRKWGCLVHTILQ